MSGASAPSRTRGSTHRCSPAPLAAPAATGTDRARRRQQAAMFASDDVILHSSSLLATGANRPSLSACVPARVSSVGPAAPQLTSC
jgi:hypothetical protein